jgi:hypothetical protein
MKTDRWGRLRGHLGAAALLLGLLAGCGGGGGAAVGPAPSANAAPLPTLTLSGQVATGADAADVSTFTGNNVLLDAGGSKDPDGDALSYRWTVVSKPAGSVFDVPAISTSQMSFNPDLAGTYVLSLRVSDSRGASAEKQATIVVRQNAAPVTALSLQVSFNAASATAPIRNVTFGSSIVLDASNSVDADGDPVTTSWELMERPPAARTNLAIVGKTAQFTPDASGGYKVRARGTDPSGAYSEVIYPIQVLGNAPQTVVLGTVTKLVGNSGTSAMEAALGYTVALSGSASSDPNGSTLGYAWTLVAKPAGSTALLSSATGAFTQLVPDALGDYVVKLVATNAASDASAFQMTVSVRNQRPEAAITSNATPNALPNAPALRMPLNTTLTLRGSASTDADGDALTYAWTLVARPPVSTAALSARSGSAVQLTTDAAGSYQVRLRVTDPAGAYSERLLNIDSGNTPPVAVADKSQVSVLAGVTVNASAALSYDDDADALTYHWAIDARPAGSSAAIAAPASAQLSFRPDMAGTYSASVTVSDGKSSRIAYLTIKALSSTANNVLLPFTPLATRYSRGVDRFVAIAANPNVLHIVDPFTGTMRQVALPLPVKAFGLSKDGKLAAVLHEGIVSLVDLEHATLIRSSLTGGSQTDVFVSNGGLVYMIGRPYFHTYEPGVYIVNGRTGENLTAESTYYGSASFYGPQYGIYSVNKGKVFMSTPGLTSGDISYFVIDPVSGKVTSTGRSPYQPGFDSSAPYYLSANEDMLFSSRGAFYFTDTLRYAGQLAISGTLLSLSHSGTADEALGMTSYLSGPYIDEVTYRPAYHRLTGPLFLPDSDIALPAIGGQQSYGVAIFHSANDNHVALVQTGIAAPNAAGNKYYLVTR